MDVKTNAKKYSKRLLVVNDKNMAKLTNKTKKKKQRKSAKTGDAKDSDPSPDPLEIEGVRALDQTGNDSDSSTQGQSEKPLDTPVIKNEDKRTIISDIKSERKTPVASPVSSTVNTVSDSMTNLQVSAKPKTVPSKGSKSKGNKSVITNGAKNTKKNSNTIVNDQKKGNTRNEQRSTESLRWEHALNDSEEERERIELYKINRRKRYLAFAQSQGLGWTVKYQSNGSPLSEDSGIETREKEPRLSLCDTHSPSASIPDFSSLKQLGASQSMTSNNLVEC